MKKSIVLSFLEKIDRKNTSFKVTPKGLFFNNEKDMQIEYLFDTNEAEYTLNADNSYKTLKAIKDCTITNGVAVHSKGQNVIQEGGIVNIMEVTDYVSESNIMIDSNDVHKALQFVGSNTFRKHFECVLFDVKNGYIVATDGHALLKKEIEKSEANNFLLHKDMLQYLPKANQLQYIEATNYIIFIDTFIIEGVSIMAKYTMKKSKEQYVDYNCVFPTESVQPFEAKEKSSMLDAIKILELSTDFRSIVKIENGRVCSQNFDTKKESFYNIDFISNGIAEQSFSTKLLSKAIKAIDTNSFVLEVFGGNRPAILQGEKESILVMPFVAPN